MKRKNVIPLVYELSFFNIYIYIVYFNTTGHQKSLCKCINICLYIAIIAGYTCSLHCIHWTSRMYIKQTKKRKKEKSNRNELEFFFLFFSVSRYSNNGYTSSGFCLLTWPLCMFQKFYDWNGFSITILINHLCHCILLYSNFDTFCTLLKWFRSPSS